MDENSHSSSVTQQFGPQANAYLTSASERIVSTTASDVAWPSVSTVLPSGAGLQLQSTAAQPAAATRFHMDPVFIFLR